MVKKIGDWKVDDLAFKIDTEGFDYFFGEYIDEHEFIGTILESPVKAYIHAKNQLRQALEKAGCELDSN